MKVITCLIPLLALCVLSALADNNDKNKNNNKDNENDDDNSGRSKYSSSYGNWKKVGKCERPERDECSKEGTCCGEMEGEQRYKRKCDEKGECNPNLRTEKTKSCNLTCEDDENDESGTYGKWQSLGCSVTCGKGTETFVRECYCPGTCDGNDSKTMKCKRPACDDDDHHSDNDDDDDDDDSDDHDDDDDDDDNDDNDDDDFSRYGPWEWVNQCDRPDEGKCSEEGTCCDKRKGERKMIRECKVAGNCNPKMRNKKVISCTIKCDSDYGQYGPWKRSDECERPNRGECSKDGSCCNELRGERKYKRRCSEKNTCHPKVISERTVACMIKCDDE